MSINDTIGCYESTLIEAEKSIERAIRTICNLKGSGALSEDRKNLNEALALVQFTLRGTFRLFDNPDIKVD